MIAEERQLKLEEESIGMGSIRYDKQRPLPWREEAAKLKEEAELPPGKKLIERALPLVAQAIEQKLEKPGKGGGRGAGVHAAARQLLREVPPEVLGYLGLRVVINSLSSRAALQTTLIRIGKTVAEHQMWD